MIISVHPKWAFKRRLTIPCQKQAWHGVFLLNLQELQEICWKDTGAFCENTGDPICGFICITDFHQNRGEFPKPQKYRRKCWFYRKSRRLQEIVPCLQKWVLEIGKFPPPANPSFGMTMAKIFRPALAWCGSHGITFLLTLFLCHVISRSDVLHVCCYCHGWSTRELQKAGHPKYYPSVRQTGGAWC